MIEGVAMTMSTVFISSRHSLEVFPRMHNVHPLLIEPRTSQAHMSNAIFKSWATRLPGSMPTFPGFKHTTIDIDRLELNESAQTRGGTLTICNVAVHHINAFRLSGSPCKVNQT